MHRAAAVRGVEPDVDCDPVSYLCAGRFTYITVQVQIETAVADRHHVDAPRHLRTAVDPHLHRHRLTPAPLERGSMRAADKYVRVAAARFYRGGEAHFRCLDFYFFCLQRDD